MHHDTWTSYPVVFLPKAMEYLSFEGRVNLRNPKHIFCLLEDYGTDPNDIPDEPLYIYFGRWVSQCAVCSFISVSIYKWVITITHECYLPQWLLTFFGCQSHFDLPELFPLVKLIMRPMSLWVFPSPLCISQVPGWEALFNLMIKISLYLILSYELYVP